MGIRGKDHEDKKLVSATSLKLRPSADGRRKEGKEDLRRKRDVAGDKSRKGIW